MLYALRRRAELEHLSGLSGTARRASGLEPPRGRAGRARGLVAWPARQRGLDILAQELLLPGLAKGLSDFAVRPSVLREGSSRNHDCRARRRRARARVASDADSH